MVAVMVAGVLGVSAAQFGPPVKDDTPPQVTVTLNALEKTVTVLGAPVTAWTYSGTVPGPIIRVEQGTELTIILRNAASEPHSLHTHFENYEVAYDGSSHTAPVGVVPHQADDPMGAMGMTDMIGQHPSLGTNPIGPYDPRPDADIVPPGQSRTYKFVAEEPGVFPYHCHVFPAKEHIDKGLFGMFIVYPKGWTWNDLTPSKDFGNTKAWVTDTNGKTWFEDVVVISELDPSGIAGTASVPTTGPAGKIHLANFRAWNDPYVVGPVKTGTPVRLIVADLGDEVHTWHVHGHYFNVLNKFDPLQSVLLRSDAMLIGPGESFITTMVAGKPGWWFMHDHVVPDAYAGMVPWFHVTE